MFVGEIVNPNIYFLGGESMIFCGLAISDPEACPLNTFQSTPFLQTLPFQIVRFKVMTTAKKRTIKIISFSFHLPIEWKETDILTLSSKENQVPRRFCLKS
jgi:hypothetical protein